MAEEESQRRLRRSHERLGEDARNGEIHTSDARVIAEFALAYRDENMQYAMYRPLDGLGKKDKQKKPLTIANYIARTRKFARQSPRPIITLTAEEVNKILGFLDVSRGTMVNYQGTIRKFYRYQDEYRDLEMDPDRITMWEIRDPDKVSNKSFSRDDILTSSEYQQADDAAEHPRDNAIFNTLYYTGMRNTCLRMMKWGNVDLENGRWWPNVEADGLKNFDRPDEPRPLLGAKGPLIRWRRMHPDPSDDAYIFTAKPNWNRVDAYEPIGQSAVCRIMREIKERAGIDKPMHPHMMRHNFVTVCLLEKNLRDDRVRFYIGHAPDSDVMETTYAHIGGEDYSGDAEVAWGFKDESELEDRPTFTPGRCTTCGESMKREFNLCPHCGTSYDPEADEARRETNRGMREDMADAGAKGDSRAMDAINTLADELDADPSMLAEALGVGDDDEDDANPTTASTDD